eukprot:m.290407 g.290407  ORF g.290407 m.290407 type:complete len:72 (-) comp16228_c0_seq9:7251-7466(-)
MPRADVSLLTLLVHCITVVSAINSPPGTNVVILLADDLGFGDPGFQGGRAITPHLDEMAHGSHSFVFNRFY